jgi:hypothetical protein
LGVYVSMGCNAAEKSQRNTCLLRYLHSYYAYTHHHHTTKAPNASCIMHVTPSCHAGSTRQQ